MRYITIYTIAFIYCMELVANISETESPTDAVMLKRETSVLKYKASDHKRLNQRSANANQAVQGELEVCG